MEEQVAWQHFVHEWTTDRRAATCLKQDADAILWMRHKEGGC